MSPLGGCFTPTLQIIQNTGSAIGAPTADFAKRTPPRRLVAGQKTAKWPKEAGIRMIFLSIQACQKQPLTILKRRVTDITNGQYGPLGNLAVSFIKKDICAMSGKLKNRYFCGYHGVFQALREVVARPLSFLLLSFFIFTHAFAVYSEFQDGQWFGSVPKTAALSSDCEAELQTEATHWRELRNDSKGASSHVTKRHETRNYDRQLSIDFFLVSSSYQQSFTNSFVPISDLDCQDTFSSRPPPTPISLQG